MRFNALKIGIVLLVLIGAPARADVGDEAALSGTYLNGARFDIAGERGHVVIVNFWATWCTPCRAEMPMLDKFYADHRGQGVVLVGVSEDKSENAGKVRAVLAAVHYPSALLATLAHNGFGHPHILPVTFVVGPDGKVAAVLRSTDMPLTAAALWSAVEPLLPKP